MELDLSTAILIMNHGEVVHTHSASILELFQFMGFPYSSLGPVLLMIPVFLRDYGYKLFGRNRGDIWKLVKRVTGLGDTIMTNYRDQIVGLEGETLPDSWGFANTSEAKKDS